MSVASEVADSLLQIESVEKVFPRPKQMPVLPVFRSEKSLTDSVEQQVVFAGG